jgi:hypothetical protein
MERTPTMSDPMLTPGPDHEGGVEAPSLQAEDERLKAELAKTSAAPTARRTQRWARTRRIAVGILVVLTSVTVLASTVAVWARRAVFDTDRFVSLVEPALSDPAVIDGMATFTSQQIITALDLADRVEEVLPPRLDAISGPLVTATQEFVTDQVRKVFASPGFHDILIQAITVAHTKAVALVRGDLDQLPNVVVTSGEVRLNLLPIYREVLRRLIQGAADLVGANVTLPPVSSSDEPSAALQKLSAALGRPLPDDFGQVPIMSEQKLHSIQAAADRLDRLVVLIVVFSVILFGLTLLLSINRRRTLVQLGIAVAVAFLLGRVAIHKLQERIVDSISSPAGRSAASDVFRSTFQDLRGIAVWVALLSILAAVAAYLAGRPRWLRALGAWARRSMGGAEGGRLAGWVDKHVDALRTVGVVAAVVVLLITGLGLTPLILVLAFLALYLFGLEVSRRRHAPPRPATTTPAA